jgi:hypothetical protein
LKIYSSSSIELCELGFLLFLTHALAVFNHFDTNTHESGHTSPMISHSMIGKACNLLHDELVIDHMLNPVFFFLILSNRFSDTANVTALVNLSGFLEQTNTIGVVNFRLIDTGR